MTNDVWKTYRRADGDLICGEYSFMTEPDIFEAEDDGEYFEVVEETWQLLSSRILKYGNTSRWCEICEEDVEIEEPAPGLVYCLEHRPPQ